MLATVKAACVALKLSVTPLIDLIFKRSVTVTAACCARSMEKKKRAEKKRKILIRISVSYELKIQFSLRNSETREN
jgi:hypothetical protein